MIVQNVSHKGLTDMTFTTAKADAKKAYKLMEEVAPEIGAKRRRHGRGHCEDIASSAPA